MREAAGDEILVSQRVATSVAGLVDLEEARALALKGFHRPVTACAVRGLKAKAG